MGNYLKSTLKLRGVIFLCIWREKNSSIPYLLRPTTLLLKGIERENSFPFQILLSSKLLVRIG
jgi:hypothetical protein